MTEVKRRVRISLPSRVRRGERVTVKTLIAHPMETGYRRDAFGGEIPRNILTHFRCFYRNEPVIEETLGPGIAANPFLSFAFRATGSGTVRFQWIDQQGHATTAVRELLVE